VKDIAKQYSMLTADERFRLFVEAMGRKDEQELDRLEATCPRRNYSAQEYEYTRRKMFFTVLALTSAVEKLRVDLLASNALGLALASDDDANDESAAKALEAFRKLMCLRQGKRAGWVRFCRQIGTNPDALTAPFLEHVEWIMGAAEAVTETLGGEDTAVDNDKVAAIAQRECEALVDAWDEADRGVS
jgi:hypothetical protein